MAEAGEGSSSSIVVWFRRDLRLDDNPALAAAAAAASRGSRVVPVFIWCPEEEAQFQPGRVSRWWLKQSLIQISSSLERLGAPLVVRQATSTLDALLQIVHETGATFVYYNHLYDPISLVRDQQVKQGLADNGVAVKSFRGDLLYEPWEITDEEGKAITTFSGFWSKYQIMSSDPIAPILPPRQLNGSPGEHLIMSCAIDELQLENEAEKGSNALLAKTWTPGWVAAEETLANFVSGPILKYSTSRKDINRPTSRLSPHLHFGEISVRKIFYAVRMRRLQSKDESDTESIDMFLRSIGFREYSRYQLDSKLPKISISIVARYLSFNFPFTHKRSLLTNLKHFPWRQDEGYFKSWRQGRTGYPLVDAGMRELWATGWLHCKIRVVVASFLVKFLQVPWVWGMKYFWETLLDADIENDVLGWQYISGGLPDGHELDRLRNPQDDGYKLDPEGEYVRRWLPELSRLPTTWIHHPWEAPSSILKAAGVELGSNYPRPIVELASARLRQQEAIAEMQRRNAGGVGGDEDDSTEETNCNVQQKLTIARIKGGGLETDVDQIVPSTVESSTNNPVEANKSRPTKRDLQKEEVKISSHRRQRKEENSRVPQMSSNR